MSGSRPLQTGVNRARPVVCRPTGGVTNTVSGQLAYVNGYIVGRGKVIDLRAWRKTTRSPPDPHGAGQLVDPLALAGAGRGQWVCVDRAVWAPIYASCLKPVRNLRRLWQDTLKLHRLVANPKELRQRMKVSSIDSPKGRMRCGVTPVLLARNNWPGPSPDLDYPTC